MVTTIKQTNSCKKVFRCLTTLSLVCSPLIAEKPYFQQEVHYQIEVRLDPQRHFLYGKELLTYKNNSPDELPFVWFHLYPNAYKNNHTRFAKQHEQWGNSRFYFATQEERGWIDVKFFRMHGEALSWEYQEGEIDEAKVSLTQPLKPGETVTFEIEFEVKIPVLFSRLGHLERNYSITHWYPKIAVYDRFGWHPDGYLDQGEFYGDFGSFTVSITVPTTFVLDATGTIRQPEAQEFLDSLAAETERIMKLDEKEQRKYLLNYRRDLERSDDELKTVTYYAEGVHDFAWFATERCMVQKGRYIYPSGREVDTYALFFPENFESWKHATEYIARTLELFGRWYGEYRYPKATAMDGSISGAPGAMEFPMITGIGSVELPFTRLLERTIVHEVGHNWFYGMLGSNERQDAWLDEGIVDFSTRRYMATRYPPRGLISTIGEATNGLLSEIDEQWWADQQLYLPHMTKTAQPIALRAEAFSLSNYRYMVYVKAPAMMYALKNYLGEHRFDKLMQTYFERWCFKHPTRGDFVAVCNEVAGEDISWFFEQWLDGTALPDFALGSVQVSRQNNRYHTDVDVKNRGDLWMPVDVAAVTELGDTVVTKFDPRKTKSARFMTSSELKRIEVNPQREIAETDYLNNASFPKLQLRFLFDVPSFEQSQIVLGPKLWYEPYQGWLADWNVCLHWQHHHSSA